MEREIVLITGTSSGFGYLTSVELAKKGYYVIATMRDLRNKNLLHSKMIDHNLVDNMEIFELDVTKDHQILKLQEYIMNKFGKIDILINNAGYCLGGISEYIASDEWRKQFDTNFFSVITLTNALMPMMRERRKGKIINIGSISGRFGFPGMAPYSSSKFALEGYSESLRLELIPFNVHVSIIEAGSFKTNIWEKGLANVIETNHKDYNELVQTIQENAEKTAKTAATPDAVIQLITKICSSHKPKLRYQIGKGVKSSIFARSILPWSVMEWIIKKQLKINKK
ncbi:SDR family oxidoreductase [Evansella tamaricis]|uniref:SDR family oxidoreductase n=1 Tax=Evansella tamaricis TaxID=2069301 RepID=A0ABS6JCV2_9BACI|nr:SDR family oxidoreductase [Evansella tamaricis]MBU9710183.1 SDR family oxidoreductase [Evansella tamaricis]